MSSDDTTQEVTIKLAGEVAAAEVLGEMVFAEFVTAGALTASDGEDFACLSFNVAPFWSGDENDSTVAPEDIKLLTLMFDHAELRKFFLALVAGSLSE